MTRQTLFAACCVALWGKDYFHVFPLFWHWDGKSLLFPLVYTSASEEEADFRVLWRLVRIHRQGDERLFQFQPVTACESSPELKRFSILWRLFEYERSAEGRSMRILFSPKIPLGRERAQV